MIAMRKERRQTLRHPADLDIDLILQDGTILSVKTLDISCSGLQFKCDIFVANAIEPRGIQNHSLDRQQFKIVAKLPSDDKNKLYATCSITAARRLSQEEFIVAIDFSDYEKNSEKVLKNYIAQLETGKSG